MGRWEGGRRESWKAGIIIIIVVIIIIIILVIIIVIKNPLKIHQQIIKNRLKIHQKITKHPKFFDSSSIISYHNSV